MATTKWTIDPTHSEITFKVKHLMISTVSGRFKVFEGQAETESDEFKSLRTNKSRTNGFRKNKP